MLFNSELYVIYLVIKYAKVTAVQLFLH